jgi:electron-transferring-flavoprotein dehydrogenase
MSLAQRWIGSSRSAVAAVARRPTASIVPVARVRYFASEAEMPFNPEEVERATDEVDVCIVGGGPAGLSAAIRLKQLDTEDKLRVVVLEKGSEPGE